ncbi:tetratricopeptide repeat protein [Kordia jejudonensis]|uniref:tetratricopeptide repeat protein n=1 Tax=Kordia jejudonensis TaxID=1348245 RepID=UPI0006290F0B|nr:tetratricopeptide repeat protein [Kordia jejudonensis]
MKHLKNIWIVLFTVSIAFAQNKEAEKIKQESNRYTYKGNQALQEDSFSDAEAEYRKAISKDAENATAKYNLGNAYYTNESYAEAFNRYKQATKVALTKEEKHSAYHNMGNIFMKNKEYEKAVVAYKNALRNNPKDDETRYNLALAKDMLEKNPPKDDENKEDKDKKDQKKEDENKKDQDDKKDNKDKNEDEGDKEKDKGGKDDKDKDGEGDKEKEKNKKDDKNDKENADQKDDKKQQQQAKPNQLSPQQIKSLLQAMNNAEKKTQDKLNEKKGKAIKVKAEKDW